MHYNTCSKYGTSKFLPLTLKHRFLLWKAICLAKSKPVTIVCDVFVLLRTRPSSTQYRDYKKRTCQHTITVFKASLSQVKMAI